MKKILACICMSMVLPCFADNLSQITNDFLSDETALLCERGSPCYTPYQNKEQQWLSVGKSPYPPHGLVYIDEYSIKKNKTGIFEEQHILPQDRIEPLVGKPYRRVLYLMKYDCKQKRKWQLAVKEYDKFGNWIQSFNPNNYAQNGAEKGLTLTKKEMAVVCL